MQNTSKHNNTPRKHCPKHSEAFRGIHGSGEASSTIESLKEAWECPGNPEKAWEASEASRRHGDPQESQESQKHSETFKNIKKLLKTLKKIKTLKVIKKH